MRALDDQLDVVFGVLLIGVGVALEAHQLATAEFDLPWLEEFLTPLVLLLDQFDRSNSQGQLAMLTGPYSNIAIS